ncbi:MAG TPA: hypothetical protein VLQ52_05230 [Coriobacteriia bacterium]|nr:hypothetical protein [Coriobacteriia bacterium]
MITSHGRRVRLRSAFISVLAVAAISLAVVTPAAAVSPRAVAQPKVVAEPGWPTSHLPENDPLPGEAGYLPLLPTAVQPADGMTDEEFKARDPQGFAAMLPERMKIERDLLTKVRSALAKSGISAVGTAMSADDARLAVAVLATTTYSPYGYLRFTLVPNTTSPYARNGYLGTLYFTYGIYSATVDAYKWYTVSWPARSGNNRPQDQSKIGLGPIPAYTWDFGFMYGVWRGYEPDGRVEFYPGKWRLDPWTGGPYGRSYLEVHGGTGTHTFAATSGCIRIYPSAIGSLKVYYDTKMANKKDPASAHLTVRY